MIKYLIPLLIIIPTISTDAAKLKVDPMVNTAVYNQILKVKPGIEAHYAAHLTASIYEVARAFKIEPRLLTAILAQESGFDYKAINTKTHDYGLAQINHKTAKAYHFDLKKLKTDPKYSVWAAGIVLNDFKKSHGRKEKNYWSYYNSSKPEKRKIYEQRVEKYL